jgi:YHS domain-containing protein
MKTLAVSAIVALLAVPVWAGEGAKAEKEEEKAKVAQTACPVMGGKINRDVYTDHDGKRVYFCCKGCVATFKKDPAKYVKKLEDAGVILDAAQDKCPVMGGKINRKVYVDHGGRRIYFCCAGCPEKFKKNPEEYLPKLGGEEKDAAGEKKESTTEKPKRIYKHGRRHRWLEGHKDHDDK